MLYAILCAPAWAGAGEVRVRVHRNWRSAPGTPASDEVADFPKMREGGSLTCHREPAPNRGGGGTAANHVINPRVHGSAERPLGI